MMGLVLLEEEEGFSGGAVVRIRLANAGDARDTGSIHESGRSPPEKEMATHCSLLSWETPMDKGA